jgi:hypothetical protein
VQLTGGEFDVIVIGSGRSGRETALAATREGCSTLLISLSPGTIASMMWSTSDESPLKQELIQAFIPSGSEHKNKKQPSITIQTTLNQPDRDSSIYVLQAQVQRNEHPPGSDEPAALQIGNPRTPSSGPSKSLREREMRIREKLLRRTSRHPEQDPEQDEEDEEKDAAGEKREAKPAVRKEISSIYRQRNNYLRRKLLDRPNGREKAVQIPPQPRQKDEEERTEAPKRNSAHAAQEASPISLLTSKGATGPQEPLLRMDRSRRKKQRNDGTAKVHPLIYRESPTQEKKPGKNRFQSLVWEDSKGEDPAAEQEAKPKVQPKTVKMRFADGGAEKKKPMEGDSQSVPPLHPKKAPQEQRIEQRPASEQRQINRQGNRPASSEPEREKRKISFIEREQARKILEQSGSTPLKREAIQLEDPYGYNAWEDIMPFSRGKENQSTLDASEKRKIALRGLRNLINNLG